MSSNDMTILCASLFNSDWWNRFEEVTSAELKLMCHTDRMVGDNSRWNGGGRGDDSGIGGNGGGVVISDSGGGYNG